MNNKKLTGLYFSTGFKCLAACLVTMVISVNCNRKPFVNAKLKWEKLSDDCGRKNDYFKLVSGFAGERYEFEKCLAESFPKDQMKATRQGDTVVMNFSKTTGKTALFKVTVDIDSYPKYNFVTVDNETFMVIPTRD